MVYDLFYALNAIRSYIMLMQISTYTLTKVSYFDYVMIIMNVYHDDDDVLNL